MQGKHLGVALSLGLLAFSSILPARAQDAMELVKQVSKTYHDMNRYEIKAMIVNDQHWGDESRILSEQTLIMAKDEPNKFRLQMKGSFMASTEVSDGTSVWQYVAMLDQYTKKPVDQARDSADTARFLPTNYVKRYEELAKKVSGARQLREESLSLDGTDVSCVVVEIQLKPSSDATKKPETKTFWIAKSNALVLREVSESERAAGESEHVPTKSRVEVDYKYIHVNQPVDATLFAFTPPTSAREVDDLGMPGSQRHVGLIGQAAPDFSASTLAGNKINLSDFKGKTVLLDFWATWCAPCRKSTPMIEKLSAEFKEKGLVVLGVDGGEELDTLKNFFSHASEAFPNLPDAQKNISDLYKIDTVPTFIVISRDGKVVYQSSGFGENAEKTLRAALKEQGLE